VKEKKPLDVVAGSSYFTEILKQVYEAGYGMEDDHGHSFVRYHQGGQDVLVPPK
jgi:hypothetical protein